MYALQYLLPDKYPAADGSFDAAISDMCATLKSVNARDTAVPHSALSVRLTVIINRLLNMSMRGNKPAFALYEFQK
jgi:hypothetical protein